jgi:hypothetical protein
MAAIAQKSACFRVASKAPVRKAAPVQSANRMMVWRPDNNK